MCRAGEGIAEPSAQLGKSTNTCNNTEILYILHYADFGNLETGMKEFPAASLTRATGDLFAAASVAPVAITKHRKQRFVVIRL